MKIKSTLFVVFLALAPSVFAQQQQQEQSTENRPQQAYLFSGGKRTIETGEPQAYLSSRGARTVADSVETRPQAYRVTGGATSAALTRPRIVKIADQTSETKIEKNSSLERRAFDLINEKRAMLSLPPLVWSDDVARIARLHSQNMASYKFFSHTGVDGLLVNDRADSCGVKRWQAIGENIAYNRGYDNPVEFAVELWMQSPGHRENLLNNRWKESAIGVAISADGTYYFTEVFLVRK